MIMGFLVILGGVCGLLVNYSHMLGILLSLELIMGGFIWLVGVYVGFGYGNYWLFFVFFVFIVGEGVIGLCLLIGLVRWWGSDYCGRVRFD